MNSKFRALTFILFMAFLRPALSQSVENAWVRRPLPGMKLTGAYMVIKNDTNKDISLLEIQGPDAEYYEIHTHENIDGVMKMRQLKKLKIPAMDKVMLKPKSFHIMLIQIKKGRLTKQAKKTELTLIFDNKVKLTTETKLSKGPL